MIRNMFRLHHAAQFIEPGRESTGSRARDHISNYNLLRPVIRALGGFA